MSRLFPAVVRCAVLGLLLGSASRLAAQEAAAPADASARASASSSGNLVPNGDFQAESASAPGTPEGWKLAPGITWEQEEGKRFMRLVAQQPDKLLMLYREVKIPAGTPALTISFRYRASGVKKGSNAWFDARAMLDFLDSGRQKVKPAPKPMLFKEASWATIEQTVAVSSGATTLVLMPALFRVAEGTLDLAEVKVVPAQAADVK